MAAKPLIVIVGPTASGKSSLAMDVARKYNGEIIAADSRTIYTGMDIGTAKPTATDQQDVPHHLLNVVNPGQPFSVADFKRLAVKAIEEIKARGKLPVMVGGTGLYVDAVLYDFEFNPPAVEARKKFEKYSVKELQQALAEQNIPLPNNPQNPRHLLRALETGGKPAKRGPIRGDAHVFGLQPDKEKLAQNIEKRIDVMITTGFLKEIEFLASKYGWDVEALRAPGYKAFREYMDGNATLEEAKKQFALNDLHLAKRQWTWFKRNPDIQWFESKDAAFKAIEQILQTSN